MTRRGEVNEFPPGSLGPESAGGLPAFFERVDISEWSEISPEDLVKRHRQVVGAADLPFLSPSSAAKAIKYGRSGPSRSYDLIAFRTVAACPARGPLNVLTLSGMITPRKDARREPDRTPIPASSRVEGESSRAILSLESVSETGRFRFTIGKGRSIPREPPPGFQTIDDPERPLRLDRPWFEGVVDGSGARLFPADSPPEDLRQVVQDRDLPLLITQQGRILYPGQNWFPLTELITAGRFKRMDEWGKALVQRTFPWAFYGFVSHRWQSPDQPDPDDGQASFTAWQLVAYLCEAVRIAALRGVWKPRKFNPMLNWVDGIAGSDLAEVLLVNVVRHAVQTALPWPLIREVCSLNDLLEDGGVAEARQDKGLRRLDRLLDERPMLRRLAGRIYLWCDYSCMPQPPRTAEQEATFREALQFLSEYQRLGWTLILLDDLDDYFSRAWCALEAVVACNTEGLRNYTILVGPERAELEAQGDVTAEDRHNMEYTFDNVLADRPHLIWRAILDTDVFRIQSAHECMGRLDLDATDPDDIDYLYKRFRRFPLPVQIHVDNSEIVTGVFPLPVIDRGRAVLLPLCGEPLSDDLVRGRLSLDWTDSLILDRLWMPDDREDPRSVPPYLTFPLAAPTWLIRLVLRPCHVAVVGACEGEAILLANWVRKRREGLESLLRVRVESLSWLSSDFAPVGHLVAGTLRGQPVEVPVWVLVAIGLRFTHCHTTKLIMHALLNSGREVVLVSLDEKSGNVIKCRRRRESTGDVPDSLRKIVRAATSFPTHHGGLYRGAIRRDLLRDEREPLSPSKRS